jgi:uncharacterized protein YndB with AHSA1/START domain
VSERSTEHATFTIVREYAAAPGRVFAAWADANAKASWFGPPEKPAGSYSLDFRVGGREHLTIPTGDGGQYTYDAVYRDIVEDLRLIYSYDMHRDGERISVSLATVEIEPHGEGSRLTFVEQGVFLDGLDTPAEREHGTGELMDALGEFVARAGGDG